MKQIIKVDIDTLDMEWPLEDAIKYLQDKQSEYVSKGYEDLRIEYVNSYDSHYDIQLVGNRMENDAEYNYRLQREASNEKYKLEQERITYERLKKQFES